MSDIERRTVLVVVVAELGVLAVLADLKVGGGGRRGRGRGAQLAAVVITVAGVLAVVATRRLTDPRGRIPR